MAQRVLSIKNFEKYQHYKHRLPPWVKLHVQLLDDPDFLKLPDASKWHYIGLILLASRHENAVPLDQEYIEKRLGLTMKLDLSARFLKRHVLAPNASMVCRTSGHGFTNHADSETETETETEKRESAHANGSAHALALVTGKRAIREEDGPTEKHRVLCTTLKIDLGPEWGKFKNYCLAHDKRYANFEAAFRNWLVRAKEGTYGPVPRVRQ